MNNISRSGLILGSIIAVLLTTGIAAYASVAQSDMVLSPGSSIGNCRLIQGSPGAGRDYCLSDCRNTYGEGFGRGRGYGYAECVQTCENRFWSEFDQNSRNLQREGQFIR
jgi:hypothetical protein